jgi:serpin B
VAIANSQWIDDDFEVKDEYIQVNKKWQNAEMRNQDLATEKTMNDINSWCDKNTQGCIKKILDEPLPDDCRLGLINALYFKGMWSQKFDKDNTTDEDFTNSDSSKSKVKMMHQTEQFPAYVDEDMDMVEFAYGDGKFCMDVILPHEGKELENCLKDFSTTTFSKYINNTRRINIAVSMPRMELKFRTILNKPLAELGMRNSFISGVADFSGITDYADLYISKVIQATYIKVDEEGTEAAAVTAAFELTSAGPDPNILTFNMNRPFAFVIREKDSNTILFMGKVRKL